MDIPRKLQIGSGNKYNEEFFNVDINKSRKVDMILDIAAPLPTEPVVTERFGEVTLKHGMFDYVLCEHVLEHIPNLVAAMTNMLNLLSDGGIIEIEVPYDLSYGAWMDPTHVRAFNELSWDYYCDSAWYLNWRTHRFDIVDLAYFIDSAYGKSMFEHHGQNWDAVRPMPRVIERIRVKMKKRPYTEEELKANQERAVD
ncbi:methyltransferase domain-containing protein [Hydromonas duriensis]|uniref:Methyltransferase family protein n=1 Tax=Hydromonas duriensis TaxID=1527608 RepID=A0A4V3DJU9_9BURK|nr:methyltransferase domain-containing protein [Hydromonas duriensis]TDR31005.1 methyltransferase family protein [Hydromonas duriensis]